MAPPGTSCRDIRVSQCRKRTDPRNGGGDHLLAGWVGSSLSVSLPLCYNLQVIHAARGTGGGPGQPERSICGVDCWLVALRHLEPGEISSRCGKSTQLTPIRAIDSGTLWCVLALLFGAVPDFFLVPVHHRPSGLEPRSGKRRTQPQIHQSPLGGRMQVWSRVGNAWGGGQQGRAEGVLMGWLAGWLAGFFSPSTGTSIAGITGLLSCSQHLFNALEAMQSKE